MLDWGNIKPSTFEAYYYVSQEGTKLRVFAADMTLTTSKLLVTYIQKPSPIDATTEVLSELPKQFTNAVIYSAAVMTGVQEQRQNIQDVMELYKRELQNNTF
jgi:hypothetical protein